MIEVKNLTHRYRTREEKAVHDVSLNVEKGEILIILGSSGAGKSTLLKCMNRIIEPDAGEIHVEGRDILSASVSEAEKIRRNMGMIFQQFNLIERNTVLDNVLTGRLGYTSTLNSALGRFSTEDRDIAMDCIERVSLQDYAHERVSNLSGGQKQRVGIARALTQKPGIILADEPVSALDPKLMKEIMDLLQSICTEDGITLIVSLHFLELAKKYATRVVGMKDGRIVFDGRPDELNEKNIVDIYGESRDWRLYGKVGY